MNLQTRERSIVKKKTPGWKTNHLIVGLADNTLQPCLRKKTSGGVGGWRGQATVICDARSQDLRRPDNSEIQLNPGGAPNEQEHRLRSHHITFEKNLSRWRKSGFYLYLKVSITSARKAKTNFRPKSMISNQAIWKIVGSSKILRQKFIICGGPN